MHATVVLMFPASIPLLSNSIKKVKNYGRVAIVGHVNLHLQCFGDGIATTKFKLNP